MNTLAWHEAEVIINHKFADVTMCVKWHCSDTTRLAVFFQSWLVNLINDAELVSFKPLLTIDFVCVVLERQSKKRSVRELQFHKGKNSVKISASKLISS